MPIDVEIHAVGLEIKWHETVIVRLFLLTKLVKTMWKMFLSFIPGGLEAVAAVAP